MDDHRSVTLTEWEAHVGVEVEHCDRGQAAIAVVMVMAVLFVALLAALAALGARVTDRARAQSVADAAALASVEADRVVVEGLVVRAGAEMVSWRRGPGGVTVVVRLGDAIATARATNDP